MRLRYLLAAALLTGGCGGGGDGTAPATGAPDPAPANTPPTISGTPATVVTEGEDYAFSPTASDADGDTLRFLISNKPAWATFDEATGSLAGTPQGSDIGVTSDVTISVTDGTDSAALSPFDIEVRRIAVGSATVLWDIPTTNADGTPMSDLDHFIVYYGTESGVYSQSVVVPDPQANRVVVDNLPIGTWFFAVSAVDESGNESALSDEASKVVRP